MKDFDGASTGIMSSRYLYLYPECVRFIRRVHSLVFAVALIGVALGRKSEVTPLCVSRYFLRSDKRGMLRIVSHEQRITDPFW